MSGAQRNSFPRTLPSLTGGTPRSKVEISLNGSPRDRILSAMASRDRLIERQALVMELATTVLSETCMEKAVELLLAATYQMASCDRVFLFLRDAGGHLVCQAAPAGGATGWSVPLGKGIVGEVGESGEIMNIPDARTCPELFDSHVNCIDEGESDYRIISMLCMALKDQQNGEVIGVMQLINKRDRQTPPEQSGSEDAFVPFDEFDERGLQLLLALTASQLSIIERISAKENAVMDDHQRLVEDICMQTDIDKSVAALARAVTLKVNCQQAYIFLKSGGAHADLLCRAAWPLQKSIGLRKTPDDPVFAEVAYSGKTLLLDSRNHVEEMGYLEALACNDEIKNLKRSSSASIQVSAVSALCYPLFTDNGTEILGALIAINKIVTLSDVANEVEEIGVDGAPVGFGDSEDEASREESESPRASTLHRPVPHFLDESSPQENDSRRSLDTQSMGSPTFASRSGTDRMATLERITTMDRIQGQVLRHDSCGNTINSAAMQALALGNAIHKREDKQQLAKFEESDLQRLSTLLRLGVAAVKTCDLYSRERRSTAKLSALLTLLKESSLAVEKRDMKKVVLLISSYARDIFECDRCTFFMVDNFSGMLVGHFVVDAGDGKEETTQEIRLPMQGVVGCAARDGRVLNIEDAWHNPLFSNANDKKTGYRTKTILCAPLKTSNGKVIAVIQCINKIRNEYFGQDDVQMISTISMLMSDLIQRMSLETSYNSFIKTSEHIDADVKDLFREYYAEGAPVPEQSTRRKDRSRASQTTDSIEAYVGGAVAGASARKHSSEDARSQALASIRNWRLRNYFSIAEDVELCLFRINLYFSYFGLLQKMNKEPFEAFIRGAKARYNAHTTYHNWTHAYATLHVTFLLCDSLAFRGLLEKEDLLGLFLAALGHDVEHPGYTNAFQVSTQSKLALRYNDISVLESHHAAVTCGLMHGDEQTFFDDIPAEHFRRIRKVIVESILGTDMAKHQDIVTWLESSNVGLQGIRKNGGQLDKDAGLKLGAAILHCSDLAHPTLPWQVHLEMSKNVAAEFLTQFQEETRLGLPTLPFMGKDPHDLTGLAPIQVGFVQFVAAPLWKALHHFVGEDHLNFIVQNLESNKKAWQVLGEGGEVKDVNFVVPTESDPRIGAGFEDAFDEAAARLGGLNGDIGDGAVRAKKIKDDK